MKYDTFVATTLQAREKSSNIKGTFGATGGGMSSGSLGHGSFLENSIGYKGSFGPVKAWVAYSPDESSGDAGKYTSLGVVAKVSSFQFGAVTMNQSSCDSTVSSALCSSDRNEYDALKLFGQWKKGSHTVRLQLESTEETAPTSGSTTTENDYTYLNYQFKMGKHLIDVALGDKDQTAGTGNNTANDVEWSRIAYAYNFSKKTRVFAGLVSRDDQGTTTGTADNDTDILSLGMTIKF